MRTFILTFSLAVGLLGLGACSLFESDGETDLRTFQFLVVDTDTIYARTSDPVVLRTLDSLLALPLAERNMHPNGPIAPGSGGHNDGWSWHYIPNEWIMAEMSVEVCDGEPAFVEANVSYFADTVGHYCPWSARVLADVTADR